MPIARNLSSIKTGISTNYLKCRMNHWHNRLFKICTLTPASWRTADFEVQNNNIRTRQPSPVCFGTTPETHEVHPTYQMRQSTFCTRLFRSRCSFRLIFRSLSLFSKLHLSSQNGRTWIWRIPTLPPKWETCDVVPWLSFLLRVL